MTKDEVHAMLRDRGWCLDSLQKSYIWLHPSYGPHSLVVVVNGDGTLDHDNGATSVVVRDGERKDRVSYERDELSDLLDVLDDMMQIDQAMDCMKWDPELLHLAPSGTPDDMLFAIKRASHD